MSKKIEFFTISFWSNNTVVDYPVMALFSELKEHLDKQDVSLVRRIGDKLIRFFSFYESHNQKQLVIPFGKLKDKNKPYRVNENDRLEEIPESLFDINSLGYDLEYDVMVFTTNREGPSVQIVEEYLNTFMPKTVPLKIIIEPILYNSGIEKVRNADLVRSVTLKLDLGHSLNNFYARKIDANKTTGLISAFKSIAQVAKEDSGSKVLSLTLGLGRRGGKQDTLDLESTMYLLEQINIGEDFVTEIIVAYKDGKEEKTDMAKLKNSQITLTYGCTCSGTQVSPQEVLNNINSAVSEKVIIITRYTGEYYVHRKTYDGRKLEIVKEWNDDIA